MLQFNPLRNARSNEAGLSLIEVAVSLAIFAVLILSVLVTLTRGIMQRRETFDSYLAMQSLRDQIADAQGTANEPQDLVQQVGIGSIFAKLNGVIRSVTRLTSGTLGTVVYSNEATVPTILGGPQDLNFDGDASDDLGNVSAGSDLKLLPMTFTATYQDNGGTVTLTAHRLVTQTTD